MANKTIKEIEEKLEEGVEAVGKEVEKEIKKIKKEDTKEDTKKPKKEAKVEEKKEEKIDIEKKKKELLKKAAKLKAKVESTKTEELKEKVKGKKKSDVLLPLEEYVKSGIYIGTKVVTPDMRPFVYRRRADGLAIFNTNLIDEKLKEGIEYLSKFDAKNIIVVCKRPAGKKVAEKFAELTGIKPFTKKYPAGILTNTILPDFFENELTIITDSWVDKNALNDTIKVNKKILMICDTNNFAKGADKIVIGNNKSAKSLGVIFYLLTRGYCEAKKINVNIPDLDWWTGED